MKPRPTFFDDFDDPTGAAATDVSPQEVEEIEQPTSSPATALTKEDLELLVDRISSRPVVQPQQSAPQLSQEEIDKQLRRYRPDANVVRSLFGEEADDASRIAALEHIVQGVFTYASTAADELVKARLAQMETKLAPGLTAAQTAAAQRQEDAFFTQYPVLKDKREAVEAASALLRQRNAQFPDQASAFKALAELSGKLANVSTTPTSSMARLSSGAPPASATKTKGRSDVDDLWKP